MGFFIYYVNSLRRENDVTERKVNFSFSTRFEKNSLRKSEMRKTYCKSPWRYEQMIHFSKCTEISNKIEGNLKFYVFKTG